MLDKLFLTFVTDGMIIRIAVENTHLMKIACKSMYMNTIFLVIMIFLIWSQQHLLTKETLQIHLRENSTGDISYKPTHLMV